MVLIEEILVGFESLRVISKTSLILDSFDGGFGAALTAIHANQKFRVLANLSLLLEPQQPNTVHAAILSRSSQHPTL
jgi:hypothetical protein